MKIAIFCFLISLLMPCNRQEKTADRVKKNESHQFKEPSPAIVKDAVFIEVRVRVHAFSKDSIIVITSFKNNGNSSFNLYKPLLPHDSMVEEPLAILERRSYNNVSSKHRIKVRHLKVGSEPTSFIIPETGKGYTIELKSQEKIECRVNIAKKFSFDEYLKKHSREFLVTYGAFFPYIINGRQAVELDSRDSIQKLVYYSVTPKIESDPDKMRVAFKIPRH